MKNIDEMTIAEAKEMLPQCRELLRMFGESGNVPQPQASTLDHPLVGKNVFIRTVTCYYTGRLVEIRHDEFVLEDAAWIGSTGRFSDALETGSFDEVEPYPPGPVYVGREMRVDISKWNHELPKKQK